MTDRQHHAMSPIAEPRQILLLNPWFSSLPPALADGLLLEGVIRHVQDKLIFAEGDSPNGLFALLSGEVRIRHVSEDAGASLLEIVRPGGWFGETAMLDDQARSSDALATGGATLLQIAPPAFERLTGARVEHYACFARLVCSQYRRAMTYIVTTSRLPLKVRLAKRLRGLAEARGVVSDAGVRIDLHLSQEALADMLGVSRQSLNPALRQLQAQGLVSVGYATITICDVTGLEALADSAVLQLRLPQAQFG